MMKKILTITIALFGLTCLSAAAQEQDMTASTAAIWASLQSQCGKAFSGVVTSVPEGDTQLTGVQDIVVHFDSCTPEYVRVPFHIQLEDGSWNRSRTWIFIRNDHGIELRHDHRKEDGSEDATTWYGGFAHKDVTDTQIEFVPEARVSVDGPNGGWKIILEPGVRYVYGTQRAGEFRHRLDFDLSKSIDLPELPWGYGTLPIGLQ